MEKIFSHRGAPGVGEQAEDGLATRRAVEVLETLVAFDTTSRNSNLELIEWATTVVRDRGARTRLTFDDGKRKANLLATFGPDVDNGVLLSGHTDTVPTDDQTWSADPFRLVELEGRLHGRGTSDMKGFIACCLAASQMWDTSELRVPIQLALSYDEETGCLGVPRLIEDLVAHGPRPRVAIIGEPTSMKVGRRHRGYLGFRTEFAGRAVHSSDPSRGINAITAASEFVARVAQVKAERAIGAEVTTMSVNRISGGTAMNIVPNLCEVGWEIRPAADADLDDLRRFGHETARNCGSETVRTDEVVTIPPLRPENTEIAAGLAIAWGAVDDSEVDLPFGTEAGHFQLAGIPSIVCGPGSITEAHQPDEWISLNQIAKAMEFMYKVGQWAAK